MDFKYKKVWFLPFKSSSQSFKIPSKHKSYAMVNVSVFLSDLQNGRSSSTVEVRMLHFWEARNVRCGWDLMGCSCSFLILRLLIQLCLLFILNQFSPVNFYRNIAFMNPDYNFQFLFLVSFIDFSWVIFQLLMILGIFLLFMQSCIFTVGVIYRLDAFRLLEFRSQFFFS